jgi:hypothetical protein
LIFAVIAWPLTAVEAVMRKNRGSRINTTEWR